MQRSSETTELLLPSNRWIFDASGNLVGVLNPRANGRDLRVAVDLGVLTWAALPSASSVPSGARVRVSDVGVAPGMAMVSNGTYWIPDGVQILAKSTQTSTAPANDTNENALATVTIPASLLALNNTLEILCGWTFTGSGNAKTLRVRFGGISGTQYLAVTSTFGGTGTNYATWSYVSNVNAANSQKGWWANTGFTVGTNSAPVTSAVDTTAATTLVITGQKATGSETLSLEQYFVRLTPGA